jgi:hypothetical protein
MHKFTKILCYVLGHKWDSVKLKIYSDDYISDYIKHCTNDDTFGHQCKRCGIFILKYETPEWF